MVSSWFMESGLGVGDLDFRIEGSWRLLNLTNPA